MYVRKIHHPGAWEPYLSPRLKVTPEWAFCGRLCECFVSTAASCSIITGFKFVAQFIHFACNCVIFSHWFHTTKTLLYLYHIAFQATLNLICFLSFSYKSNSHRHPNKAIIGLWQHCLQACMPYAIYSVQKK